MKLITQEMMPKLLSAGEGTCLSLYLPTHRNHPENLQDPIRFKNLLKQLEDSLLQTHTGDEVKAMLQQFEELGNNIDFWNHTPDGIAVLCAPGLFEVIGLPVYVEELAVVADSLHTKPLRKYLQSVDRFQVLGLSLHDMQLFEGNRHSIAPVEMKEAMPSNIKQALGDELTEEHLTVASYGGSGGASVNMVHGHGSRKDELDKDAERYFRVVAREVADRYSKPSGLPLILAALPEHHNLFKKVSNNPMLVAEGVTINPKDISNSELAARAWQVVEPEYLQRLAAAADSFNLARSKELGSSDMAEVARAAVEARVDTLLLESNRVIAGRIKDMTTGVIETEDLQNPEVDDLLDDIAEIVTRMGGKVMVVPTENMPVSTGIAATYRY